MSKLSKQLTTLAKQGGGSFKTVADRFKIASRIADRMAKLNIQICDVKHIKTNHIELYIKSRQEEGISKRTLQNEMAGIRNILAVAGRTKLASPRHENSVIMRLVYQMRAAMVRKWLLAKNGI